MITHLAKLGTGLVMGSIGLPLRSLIFAAMSWAIWQFCFVPFCGLFLVPFPLFPIEIVIPASALMAMIVSYAGLSEDAIMDNRCYEIRSMATSANFVRIAHRVPFFCWCFITNDGNDVPLWAILLLPIICTADTVICVGAVIGLPCWGLWLVLAMIVRLIWRVLNIRPLEE